MTKARDLAELIGNSLIDGDEIATGAVGTSNLAATLDFSSKTMVMADNQLSGDKIHGGTVSAFTSTGIDDNATVNILTVSDTTPLLIKKAGPTSAAQEFLRLENSAGGGAAAGSSINFHHYHAGGGPAGGAKAASITAQNMAAWPGGVPSSYSTGLTFGTLHENTFAERMWIKSDGKVGIGYSNPQNSIHVLGSSSISNVGLTLQTHDTANAIANINLMSRLADNTNRTVELRAYRGNLAILGDSGYGKVGIGTDVPSDKLEVLRTSTDQTVGLTLTNTQAGGYGSGIVWKSKRGDSPNDILTAAKIVVTGANSWGSDNNTASQMQFWTQKDNTLTKHMTLSKNGKLGIGIASPGNTLHVTSPGHNTYSSTVTKGTNHTGLSIVQEGGNTDMTGVFFGSGGSGSGSHWSAITGSRTAHASHWGTQLNFYTHANDTANLADATQKMIIDGDGNVGIGTLDPARPLNIVNDAGSNPIQSIRNSNTAWSQYALTRYGTEGEDVRYMDFGYYRGATEPTRGLVIKSQANATLVTFLDSGNVGIGTSNPNSKLHVQTSHTQTSVSNANSNTTLNLGNSGVGNGVFNALKFSGNQQDMYIMSFNHSAAASRRLGFFVGSVAGDAIADEKLSISGSGNVGIGTTNPSAKLHLATTGSEDMALGIQNSERYYKIHTDGGNLSFTDISAGLAERMTILANGYVGVNTTNPNTHLDVNGTFSANSHEWGTSNAVFGQDRYKIRELNNWFWAAGKRFGGYGSSSNLHNGMFDGNFDNGHTFAANSTHVITIDHRNQATLTYPSGDAYFSFYHVNNQFTSITGRAYHTAGGAAGTWSNLGTATDINGGPGSGARVVKLQGPPGNYIGMWEFTIVTGSNSINVTDLSYNMTRATGENSSPAFRVDRTQDVVHTTNYRNNSGTVVGTIVPTSSGCTFNNLSDYRFKQNVTDITGASDRLKLLKPKNFSWTTDETDTLEDGFLAHEVAEVIPNAVIGEKDAVVPPELYGVNDPIPEGFSVGDVKLENGEMEPQLLDQVKLIPLLTAALKEALDRIEVLEQG